MLDTIQVIRVERVASGDIDDGDFVAGDGEDFKVYQVVGDVMELTEHVEYVFGTPILHHYRSLEEPVEVNDA